MGRTLPIECEHGKIVDWGDFGETTGGVFEDPPGCDVCEVRDAERRDDLVLGTLLRRILEDEEFGGHLFIDGDWPLTPEERAVVERVLASD